MSSERCTEPDLEFQHQPNCCSLHQINTNDEHRHSISTCSQIDRPRKSRQGSNVQFSNRRSSVHSGYTRTRANSRVTPLGDGRRASVCKRGGGGGGGGGKRRRSSTAHRRDSIRPSRPEIKVSSAIEFKTPEEIQEATRRHRKIAIIVAITFIFLLLVSVLTVIVTLTHSSFYIPPLAPNELNRLRDNEMRKENEALLNSLNQDSSGTENSTTNP